MKKNGQKKTLHSGFEPVSQSVDALIHSAICERYLHLFSSRIYLLFIRNIYLSHREHMHIEKRDLKKREESGNESHV
jgi:hypothetical protein